MRSPREPAAQDAAKKKAGGTFKPSALWGVPIVVKANTSIQGQVTSNGWAGYLVKGYELVAPKDAAIVAKLKASGAVILGHTNMPDFAASDTTLSSAGGRTGNAYNWRFSPGGSSGGTATAVSANFAVFGTGTDTSNSIRLPSGANGLVGVLPTRGLVSINGIHPLDWLLDDAGPMARTVTDAAIALGVMAGEDPADFPHGWFRPRPSQGRTPGISNRMRSRANVSVSRHSSSAMRSAAFPMETRFGPKRALYSRRQSKPFAPLEQRSLLMMQSFRIAFTR